MEDAPRLAAVDVTDRPELWAGLGFAVDGTGRCRVSGVALRLGAGDPGGGSGLRSWTVDGAPGLAELPIGDPEPGPGAGDPGRADGSGPDAASRPGVGAHPNGVEALDHVVVTTPDLDRTVAAFEAAGLPLKRIRQAGAGVMQAFFRLGPVIVEVVSRPDADPTGPAALWGLAFTVSDLALTASVLGDRLRPARPAVQPGRHIAALDRAAGSGVPIVFMSPHPGRDAG